MTIKDFINNELKGIAEKALKQAGDEECNKILPKLQVLDLSDTKVLKNLLKESSIIDCHSLQLLFVKSINYLILKEDKGYLEVIRKLENENRLDLNFEL